jgi:hypothetical protein
MILAESFNRTGLLGAAVTALPPQQLRRRAESWDVVQPTYPPTVSGCDHATTRAAGLGRLRLHRQPQTRRQLAMAVSPGNIEHVHAGHSEQGVDARTVAARLHATRRGSAIVEVLQSGRLGRY